MWIDSSERTGWDGEEERDCLVLLCGVMGSVHSSWVRSREGWPKWACYASTNIFHIFIKFADSCGHFAQFELSAQLLI